MRQNPRRTLWIAPLVMFLFTIPASAASISARITRTKGTVEVRETDSSAWTKAAEGITAGENATVRTGANSEAFLVWQENSVRVGPMSVVSIETLTDDGNDVTATKLNIAEGAVFAKVRKLNNKSTFTVRTPTAIAGVRGTSFEASQRRFAVTDGNISVAAKGREVELPSGQMVEVSESGEVSEPTLIPATVLKELYDLDKQCGEVISEEMQHCGAQDKGKGCQNGPDQTKQQEQPMEEPAAPDIDQSMDQSNGITDRVVDVIDTFGDRVDQMPPNTCDVNITITY